MRWEASTVAGRGEETRREMALRPRHVALGSFALTLLAYAPTALYFAPAPQFAAIADSFTFAFLLASLLAAIVLALRALAPPSALVPRRAATFVAVPAYLAGTLAFVALLFAPAPLPWGAVATGLAAGAALPWLVAEWARAVAAPMGRALALVAFVVVAVSFGGWVLTLLPLYLITPVFCLLVFAGAVPLLFIPEARRPVADSASPSDAMGRLVSVTWLPLLGLAVYAFMSAIMVHSAFGVVQASFLGGVIAALVAFGACLHRKARPLLPWCYRILVPLMAAVFVVLGAFPAGTFPKDVSVVALYVFYIVLALVGCALLLAVVHSREVPSGAAVGLGVGVCAASALLGHILSAVLAVTSDFGPWLTVLTGAFIAVLLLFLGRTAWSELVAPTGDDAACPGSPDAAAAPGGAAPGVQGLSPDGASEEAPARSGAIDDASAPVPPEPSVRDTLEARCAHVAEERQLSPREAEVLVYLARGFTPAYIAKELVLSISTVRTHVRNIYRKLGIGKREELLHLIDGE